MALKSTSVAINNPAGEFSLIKKYFTNHTNQDLIGDDTAVVSVPPDQQLLSCVDTMVQDIHFLSTDNPQALGHKLIAVNLSDIAAMGGTPKWATLALTIPEINHQWLNKFSQGLLATAAKFEVILIGGDTTKGNNLVLSLQLMGTIPKSQAILRSTAQVGDLIFVTGSLGGAAYQLQQKLINNQLGLNYLDYPQPQITIGKKLRTLATAMIDISDGLIQDLTHILTASKIGAQIDADKIPFAPEIANHAQKYDYAFGGGEDYQLLFTINKNDARKLLACDIIASQIGIITSSKTLEIINHHQINYQGYNHFN